MSKKNAAPKSQPTTVPPQTQSEAKEGEYKGHPVLALHRSAEDKSPLSFGLVKAGLILAHVEDIKAFSAKHSKQEVPAAA